MGGIRTDKYNIVRTALKKLAKSPIDKMWHKRKVGHTSRLSWTDKHDKIIMAHKMVWEID